MNKTVFPKGFLWGASTAAHQVEGNLQNQWSDWEKQNADRLAFEFDKKLSWLPRYQELRPQGTDRANYISGHGVEHYDRYKEDIALMKKLNLNAYRFGIEWSRIEPKEGVWDKKAIEHYRDVIKELKRQGIEPLPTLWHWSMPLWFTRKQDFEKRTNLMYFERFVRKMAEEYGNELTYLITLNEPNVYVTCGYISAEWPPQRKNYLLAFRVYLNLVMAHRRAYAVIKKAAPHVQVGIAQNMVGAKPTPTEDALGKLTSSFVRYVFNRWFLNRIRSKQDFVGVNYYFANYYHGAHPHAVSGLQSDLGWYMEPSNIEQVVLDTWAHFKLPIIITENGLADEKDANRKWWISETLAALERTLQHGVDLRGYMHWSLIDNFEWAYGWWPQFGLISVDRKTQKRTIRDSAKWFAHQIRELQA